MTQRSASPGTFLDICEDAMCAPDTRMTDQELRDRLETVGGCNLPTEAITQARDAFWKSLDEATSVTLGSWRL